VSVGEAEGSHVRGEDVEGWGAHLACGQGGIGQVGVGGSEYQAGVGLFLVDGVGLFDEAAALVPLFVKKDDHRDGEVSAVLQPAVRQVEVRIAIKEADFPLLRYLGHARQGGQIADRIPAPVFG